MPLHTFLRYDSVAPADQCQLAKFVVQAGDAWSRIGRLGGMRAVGKRAVKGSGRK